MSTHPNLLPPPSSSSDGGQPSSMEGVSATPSPANRTRFYPTPKPRFKWGADLHRRFLEAVAVLGGEQRATPKTILELLDEKDLTLSQVRTHLQIHRNHCYERQQMAREAEAAALAAQMAWSASVHGLPQGYPYGHQFYSFPPPQSALQPPLLPPAPQQQLPPMPTTIPSSMRGMNSAPRPKTIVFNKLFPKNRPWRINEEATVQASSSSARNEIQDDVSLDLTLSTKPARH